MKVSVDMNRCHFYGQCVIEADVVFDLAPDGTLHYQARPDAADHERVRRASMMCPMQAITLTENGRRRRG